VRQSRSRESQPAKLRKGASPAEIKAWIAEGLAQATATERAEYEATGEALREIFARIGFDPASGSFTPRERLLTIDLVPQDP
jgi:hypothetical protein